MQMVKNEERLIKRRTGRGRLSMEVHFVLIAKNRWKILESYGVRPLQQQFQY